jgi:C-terminal processing protease CtpA/Prc
MLAGIGSLLKEEGVQGGFLAKDGKITPWIYEGGMAKMGEETKLKIPEPYRVKNKNIPIAVTINGRTASSAEAILISFIGQSNTKVFGTPTAGLSTANGRYELRDGAQLIITSAVFTDRKGKVYGGKIKPDVYLENTLSTIFSRRTKAAEEWILSTSKKNNDNR